MEKSLEKRLDELKREAIDAVAKLVETGKASSPELVERKLLEVSRAVNFYLAEVRSAKTKKSYGVRPPL